MQSFSSELNPKPLGSCKRLRLVGEASLNLVHITLGRKKDPFFLDIRNPIPQKVKRIPNIDPVKSGFGEL